MPSLIHCAHGKDRTGVVIMLLLLICDTPHEAIVQDYIQVKGPLWAADLWDVRGPALLSHAALHVLGNAS